MVSYQLLIINRKTLFLLKLKPNHLLFSLDPFLLVTCHQSIATHPVLESVELVNDYSHKQIQDENVPNNDERDEVKRNHLVIVVFGLLTNVNTIDAFVHYLKPALRRDGLIQNELGLEYIVEVLIAIFPNATALDAVLLIYDIGIKLLVFEAFNRRASVETSVEFTLE